MKDIKKLREQYKIYCIMNNLVENEKGEKGEQEKKLRKLKTYNIKKELGKMKNKKMIKELNNIIKSTKNILELHDYEDVREYDSYYNFNKSIDEILIDLITYKNSFIDGKY